MSSADRGSAAAVGTFIVVGMIVLVVVAAVIAVGWSTPGVVAGDVPEYSHSVSCVNGRCSPDTRSADLTFLLTARGHTSTRLAVLDDGRETVTHEMDGTLEIEDPDGCPRAAVRWTLTPRRDPAARPVPLTAAAPDTDLDAIVLPPEGTTEVRLDLERVDAAACDVPVVWHQASFHDAGGPPEGTPGLPGMGGGR